MRLGGEWTAWLALALTACGHAPPRSVFPSADLAIQRMRATTSCSHGVRGESKIEYFAGIVSVRASALYVASRPDRIRIDLFSPFGATLSTLTSDGTDFSLLDFTSKQFFTGPARDCNLTRFLRVPVPALALVALLDGEAPVLVHSPSQASIEWDGSAYRISVASLHDAHQTIRLEPLSDDYSLPWSQQRVRVREVRVVQRGIELYRANLDDFAVAETAPPQVDPEGIDPDLPPSGPACRAELARRIHIRSEASGQNIVLVQKEVVHNPPLVPGVFKQVAPAWATLNAATCR
jgi:hypothetical protein